MEYTTLTEVEKLAIARDALRARESEYYSLSLSPSQPGAAQRMEQLEVDAKRYRTEIDRLVSEVGDVVPDRVPEPEHAEDVPKAQKDKPEAPKQALKTKPDEPAKPKTTTRRTRKPAAKKKDE